ncbi:hypothetical protein NQ318_001554 [Aromia moschata]|uniref:Uncharacterized protein n=1 Tax=Aromia moschata TaxID=1265417 RepID=A0AAV8YB54_9CUCU|nr:hypothetical protein NQ318_001554 [Aromia moschata]
MENTCKRQIIFVDIVSFWIKSCLNEKWLKNHVSSAIVCFFLIDHPRHISNTWKKVAKKLKKINFKF